MADLDSLTITKGDDAKRTLTITRNGAPLDITTMTVTWVAVHEPGEDPPALGPYTGEVTDGPGGQAEVSLPGSDSADLDGWALLWDATVTDAQDRVVHVARGSLFALDPLT